MLTTFERDGHPLIQSNTQILRGLSLLMYPTAVIEAAIERAAAEFPNDAPDTEHFLALANYSLEKADEFSGHLLMVSEVAGWESHNGTSW